MRTTMASWCWAATNPACKYRNIRNTSFKERPFSPGVLLQQTKQASEEVGWGRRTSFDVQIDGNDILDAAYHGVAAGEDAAVYGTRPDSNHPLWIGRSVICAQQ